MLLTHSISTTSSHLATICDRQSTKSSIQNDGETNFFFCTALSVSHGRIYTDAYPEGIADVDDERRRRRLDEDPLAVPGLHLVPIHLVLAHDAEPVGVLMGDVPGHLLVGIGRPVLGHPEQVPEGLALRLVVLRHAEPFQDYPPHHPLQIRDALRRAIDDLAVCVSSQSKSTKLNQDLRRMGWGYIGLIITRSRRRRWRRGATRGRRRRGRSRA